MEVDGGGEGWGRRERERETKEWGVEGRGGGGPLEDNVF